VLVGEIIDVSTTRFTAQCSELNNPPHFGSFIKTDGIETGENKMAVYGVIFNVRETSIDPTRRPVAHGLSPDDLRRQYPHLGEFLKVEFEAAIIGFGDGTRIRTYLPPFPPRIHNFVYDCETSEILELANDLEFIRTLNSLSGLPIEELIAATIRSIYLARDNDQAFLVRAGQEIARLLKDDYEKVRSILRRISIT
jgi:hypothetical protein